MRFGQGPLSTPAMVELLETFFVPLCIYNNHKGTDARVLARYEEPSWNNPVFRFFTGAGTELLPRKDGVWTLEGLAARTSAALAKAGTELPPWAKGLLVDLGTPKARAETATFAMHCFWEGERRFGLLPGVLSTHAAWLEGKEVVEVRFDREALSFATLLQTAKDVKCLHHVFARSDAQATHAKAANLAPVSRTDESVRSAKASDRHYYLSKTPLQHLPLTPGQAARVNAALGLQQDPAPHLSPRQRTLAKRIQETRGLDPARLRDLVRPDKLEELAAYEARLRKALPAPE